MRTFEATASLLAAFGLGFSYIHSQSQTAPVQQNSTSPIQPPPDAAVLRAEVCKIEDSLRRIPDRAAALFLLAKRYAQLGEPQKLKECIALDEGFDPADSPALLILWPLLTPW